MTLAEGSSRVLLDVLHKANRREWSRYDAHFQFFLDILQNEVLKRKKTLLKEYEEKGRAGGVVDRRFGENDPTLSLEERMLERFTKERQRVSKGAAFNLEDEEELTHYGQSLSKLDDFDNVGLGLDDDDDNRGVYYFFVTLTVLCLLAS